MPTPKQTRDKRLRRLIRWAKKQNKTPTFDQIYNQAIALYPLTADRTLRDYSRAVMRALKKKKEES